MNELALLSGDPLAVKCGITVNHPTIGQVCAFDEEKYYQMLSILIAVPQDFRVLLWDEGTDCDEISEFDLFIKFYKAFEPNDTAIFFGNYDLRLLEPCLNRKNNEIVLYDPDNDILLDSFSHHQIIDFLRKINRIEKRIKRCGNEYTKRRMVEIDRQNIEIAKSKKNEFESIIVPQLSALVNSAGFKYDYKTCMDLPLYAFFDASNRIQRIKYFDALLHGIYAGTVDSSKVSKDELNWME